MSYKDKAPYIPQDPKEISRLISALEGGSGKGRRKGAFSCRKSTYKVAGTRDVYVNSWKFNDWDYKRDDLPTYARGLFTYKRKDGVPEIAIRGYDKFFNVGEVNDTQWDNVENFTKGPYELSVKENGCIIFISGLENNTILVCSKHSTGAREDALAHAVVGERWLEKHLASVGKTKEDLAKELRERNVTAVAELCDDSFEEHVLAYEEDVAGLYLHGMNVNVPEFATYSGSMVHKFADEWGFKKAEYLVEDDVNSMKTFLEKCAETGSWSGRDTEGFVIRCEKKGGIDWFFKYKFDEPYLMYRQWREATKAVIAGKAPKYKKHVKITEEYLKFARRRLAQTPGLAKAYNQNHGIIKMRDDFLKERGVKGSDLVREEEPEEAAHNVILVPIATIGCGKTTVALALVNLFKWGHIQNDNITGKKNRPAQFVNQLGIQLAEYKVVIADRNNHQKRERKQLIDDMTKIVPDAKFVALHYVHDPKDMMLPEIRVKTQERIFERGDNHQTIHAGTKSRQEIMEIMEGFLRRFEPLDRENEPDNDFDEVIDLDVTEDSRRNLDLVVNALHKAYPKIVPTVPSPEELDNAIHASLNDYTPSLKHDLSFNSKNKENRKQSSQQSKQPKPPKLEYFAVRVPTNQILSNLENSFQGQDATTSQFFRQLKASRRVQASFHITLMHRASSDANPKLWNDMVSKWESERQEQGVPDPLLGKCLVRLERVVWDKRLMCIMARLEDGDWKTTNAFAHITIGTASSDIKPKESNDLLSRWHKEHPGDIRDLEVKGNPEVWGEVKGVTLGTR